MARHLASLRFLGWEDLASVVGERGARRSCYGLLAEAKSACTGSVVPLFYQQAAHRHSNHRIFTDWEAEAGGKRGASEVFRRFPSSQNGDF